LWWDSSLKNNNLENNYSHSHDMNLSNAFKTGIAVNIGLIIVEATCGYFSNSMILIAWDGHNFSNVLAIIFA
jgi:cobalt-zinc-cadmium efflux system protein